MPAQTRAWIASELERLSWFDIEQYLEQDSRLVLTVGATEEHAHLSLATDTLLGTEIARRAAAAEHVLIAPPLHFGNSVWAAAYPGTLWLSPSTLAAVVSDLIRSAYTTGFRRILVVSGHSGNDLVLAHLQESLMSLADLRCDYFAWYREPEVLELARTIRDDGLDHANWGENMPFTRLAHHHAPTEQQEPPEFARDYVFLHPAAVREAAPRGMHGVVAQVPDAEADRLIDRAVDLARERLRELAG